MNHTMKMWERVLKAKLKEEAIIYEQLNGVMPRKSNTNATLALRMLMEKYRGQKYLHHLFVNREK